MFYASLTAKLTLFRLPQALDKSHGLALQPAGHAAPSARVDELHELLRSENDWGGGGKHERNGLSETPPSARVTPVALGLCAQPKYQRLVHRRRIKRTNTSIFDGQAAIDRLRDAFFRSSGVLAMVKVEWWMKAIRQVTPAKTCGKRPKTQPRCPAQIPSKADNVENPKRSA